MTDPTTLRTALEALIADGIEAFRLTREYVGDDVLPDEPGWSWFDWAQRARAALATPAPAADEADALRSRVAELEEALDRILRINSGPEALLGSSPACASARVESANIARAALATPAPAADPTTLRTALEAWLYEHAGNGHTINAYADIREAALGTIRRVAYLRCANDQSTHNLLTPAPAADEARCASDAEHDWWLNESHEAFICRKCPTTAAIIGGPTICFPDCPYHQPAPTPAPPTPPATEPVAALRDELERRVAAVLTKFAGDEIMDLADRYAAARAEVDVEALALALHDAHIECRFWYVDGARTESEFHHDHATRIIAALARRAGEGTVTDLDPRWAFCLTSCGCDGRSLAIECSGDFPASHGGRCKRCTR